jgi:hypothetical protein
MVQDDILVRSVGEVLDHTDGKRRIGNCFLAAEQLACEGQASMDGWSDSGDHTGLGSVLQPFPSVSVCAGFEVENFY